MNFSGWLALQEMAFVSKQPVYLDKDDIDYLKQFPLFFWARALKMRYNDFVLKALRKGPNEVSIISSNWSDVQNVSFEGDKRSKNPLGFSGPIKVGMNKVIDKLQKLGYDLSGTSSSSESSLYYKLIDIGLANVLKTKLITTISPSRLEQYKQEVSRYRAKNMQIPKSAIRILDPKPNVVFFVPNYLASNRNDPEPGKAEDMVYEKSWREFKPKIDEIIGYYVKNIVHIARNKTNALYWSSGAKDKNGRTITEQLYDHLRNNWKQIRHEEKFIRYAVNLKINTILQNGIISRRLDDFLKKSRIDLFGIIQKMKWTPLQAKAFIEKNKADPNLLIKSLKRL